MLLLETAPVELAYSGSTGDRRCAVRSWDFLCPPNDEDVVGFVRT